MLIEHPWQILCSGLTWLPKPSLPAPCVILPAYFTLTFNQVPRKKSNHLQNLVSSFLYFFLPLLCVLLSALFLLIYFSCLMVRAASPAISSMWQGFFATVWWWIEKHNQTYCHQWCHCTTEIHAVVIYWEAGHTSQWQTVLAHLYHLWWAALVLFHWLWCTGLSS